MNYELHPLCTLFPRMGGSEFAALIADIRENGQREPIILHEGMILDGGNRYRACVEAGIEPQFMQFGGGNLVAYVLSANLHRRHMTAGQQAAIVASAQDWAKAQTVGNPAFSAQSCNLAPLATAATRAAESGASLRTQKMADKVAREAPDLIKKVGHGEMSLPAAVESITGKRPGAKAPAAEPEDFGPDAAEIAEAEAAEAADRAALQLLLDSDDKLKTAHNEIKRLNAVVAVLESRIRGLQNETNEAKRIAQQWKRAAEKKAA